MKKIIQIATVNVGYIGLVALTSDGMLYRLGGDSVMKDTYKWIPMPEIPDDPVPNKNDPNTLEMI